MIFFAQVCVSLWTKFKRCFGRVFSHFTIFGFKNAKINFLKKKKCFECSFYRIQVQVIANLPCRLEKKHQTFDIYLMTDFYEFLKLIIFRFFRNFRNSLAAHTKIIVCVLSYVNTFDKTPCNLMSPFSNCIFFLLIWYPLPILT